MYVKRFLQLDCVTQIVQSFIESFIEILRVSLLQQSWAVRTKCLFCRVTSIKLLTLTKTNKWLIFKFKVENKFSGDSSEPPYLKVALKSLKACKHVYFNM